MSRDRRQKTMRQKTGDEDADDEKEVGGTRLGGCGLRGQSAWRMKWQHLVFCLLSPDLLSFP